MNAVLRQGVAAALCCLILLMTTACTDDMRVPPELEQKRVRIRFWHAMAGRLERTLRKLVDRFERDNPDIDVVPVYQGSYGALSQKLISAVIAGTPPDMAQFYPAWIAYLNAGGEKETVLCLDGLVREDPSLRPDDFFQPLIEDCRLDGRLYSLPFNKSFPVLYYNKEAFRKAGLDPSHPPATWKEFAEYGRRLTVDSDGDGKPDRCGWAFTIDSWIFECLVLAFGGQLIDASGTPHLADPPAVEALRFFCDATYGKDPYAVQVTGYDYQLEFAARRAAMVVASCTVRNYMDPKISFEYGVAPLPRGKRPAAVIAGTNIGIFASCTGRKRKAAWRFLKFLVSREASAYWSMNTSYVPVRKSALLLPAMKRYLEMDPAAMAPIREMDYAYFEPALPQWYECRQILNSYIEKTFSGRLDPVEALREANADIAERLKRK